MGAGPEATGFDPVSELRAAVAAEPGSWVLQTRLGNALKAAGHGAEAIAVLIRAVELAGERAETWTNLGLAYQASGRLPEALLCLERAGALAPDVPEIQVNWAGALLRAERFDEALAVSERALLLAPGSARAAINAGLAAKGQGRLAAAEELFRRAVARDPEEADAHWNLGLTLLVRGAEAEGWRELEWRQRIPALQVPPPAGGRPGALWDGESLAGRTLLLQAEQGLGDTLQFLRYARLVRATRSPGAIIVECPPALVRLLRSAAAVDAVVARGACCPAYDVRAGVMSLPALLGVGAAASAATVPYLSPEPARVVAWKVRLAEHEAAAGTRPRLRVGIAWQGNPRYRADHHRSIPLAAFAPLLAAARSLGASIYSLQKGAGAEQLSRLPPDLRVQDLGPELDRDGAFVDTAAVLAGLDLVVTSDTSLPHLAGALGRPLWLLLPHVPDWRWETGTAEVGPDRTAWYRTARVFRQPRPGDWAAVFTRVTDALRVLLQGETR